MPSTGQNSPAASEDVPCSFPGAPVGATFSEKVLAAAARLRDGADGLRFAPPVALVYNPLRYAWPVHEQYVRRWGASPRRVLLLGMNPGPWGMAQTGVPFGEVAAVKEWLGLDAPVQAPPVQHPRRPIQGLACPRSEVSGRRLWGMFAEVFGSPAAFFADHFVANYCPLVFLEESARNLTPDRLPAPESRALFALCDEHLTALVDLLCPRWVVGVGGFAQGRLQALYGPRAMVPAPGHRPAGVGGILHPSPASPAANRGWAAAAQRQLREQGVWV